eukprot:TRINITY_DN2078_c0_g1_i2.p1 TRINITY_DN2078_c0_g1~~TRINITY_DN2078_c0_g1_i2.p1  ORF type:complete len:262 (-),score=55.28 TRINITY_DN2078_c0_g1_i2:77-862(-)
MTTTRFFILCIFALTAVTTDQNLRVFRYTNGTHIRGKTQYGSISGTLWHMPLQIAYFGMHTPTMVPFFFMGMLIGVPNGLDNKYRCLAFRTPSGMKVRLKGTADVKGTEEKVELIGDCETQEGEALQFRSVNNRSKTMFFPPEQAGYRVRALIGRSSSMFTPASIIYYAFLDAPYLINKGCGDEFKHYPDAEGPGPGIVILGKDGRNCAMLDNEGTKFVHIHPTTREIRADSIALVRTYFPSGHEYKAYPNEVSAGVLNKS